MRGIVAYYKKKGPTSHAIIQNIRRATGIKKIGHAGTLDPLARGILVVGIGRQATKKLSAYVAKEKEYIAIIHLGYTTPTHDAEGKKTKTYDARQQSKPSVQTIKTLLKKFVGRISQTPPLFSAIKIQGKEAYKHARRGNDIVMVPRPAHIKKITVESYHWPYIHCRVVTGPGVYIRSLARDIGKELGTGAYLKALERIRVGAYTKERALSLSQIKLYIKKNGIS